MPVPDFQSLMLPCLRALEDGRESRIEELRQRVAASEGLTANDLQEMQPSGGQALFPNRVSWALTHMRHAGLLESPKRGINRLTREGKLLLARKPSCINLKLLQEFPGYAEWRNNLKATPSNEEATSESTSDPRRSFEEIIDSAARRLRNALEAEVLAKVRAAEPEVLKRVAVDLLDAMGYGSDTRQGREAKSLGDGRFDGTIVEDPLGLDKVCLQAKKYAEGNPVGESALRDFSGAIDVEGTTKGVFVTTSSYTGEAKEFVRRSTKRIILIDGAELARLLVQYGIGVRTRTRYEIKRIDEDYFDQESM